VIHGLERRGISARPELVEKIFISAQRADRLLTDDEIMELCGRPAP